MTSETKRPALFLDPETWEALPERLEDPYFAQIAATNGDAINFIETTLWGEGGEPVPPGEISGLEVRSWWRWMKARLLRNVVAWYLERDPVALDRCRHTLQCLLDPEAWDVMYRMAGVDQFGLRKGEMTFTAVFGLDVLGAYLDDVLRGQLKQVLVDIALRDYEVGFDEGDWWRHANFNWGSATHGNAGLAALLLEPEHPELCARVLRRVHEGLGFVIEALPAEGGWTEGMMYMTTMLAHLTDYVAALHRVKGDDLGLCANPRLAAALDYRAYMIGGDGCPINFSNCDLGSDQYCFPQGYWWATQCNRPEWAGFEEDHIKPPHGEGLFHDVEAFWYREPFQPSTKPVLKRLRHFRGLDWFKWTGDDTWLAFRGGCNGGNHNNCDLGHFVFGAGPDRFLIDPGYGAGAACQHNTLTVRGGDQAQSATAPIFCVREFDRGFYLACDLTDVSPHVLALYTRHLLLVDEAHLLVVDHLIGRRGNRVGAGLHLQTTLPHELTSDGIQLLGAETNLLIRRLTPTRLLEAQSWEWVKSEVTSFHWRPGVDWHECQHAMVMTLGDRPAPAFRLEAGCAELTHDGSTWRIDLLEGSIRCAPEGQAV